MVVLLDIVLRINNVAVLATTVVNDDAANFFVVLHRQLIGVVEEDISTINCTNGN
jgi:hypothetical protein